MNPKDLTMTRDQKTILLILWMAFSCAIMGAACYIYGALLITHEKITEPILLATVQGMSDKAAVGLAAAATVLISTLARVRTDPQSTTGDAIVPPQVEVINSPDNPVPTDQQPSANTLPASPTDTLTDAPKEGIPHE